MFCDLFRQFGAIAGANSWAYENPRAKSQLLIAENEHVLMLENQHRVTTPSTPTSSIYHQAEWTQLENNNINESPLEPSLIATNSDKEPAHKRQRVAEHDVSFPPEWLHGLDYDPLANGNIQNSWATSFSLFDEEHLVM